MKDKEYIVYRHVCPNGKVYIGVTNSVESRWFPSLYRNGTPFKDAIIEFGWENIKHEILYSNLTRDEALKLEDELICKARENGTCLNVRRSGHHTESDDFKQECKVRKKAYHETHKEDDNARSKAYHETHKENDNARSKAYYEANKEKIKAYQKAHLEANKDEINARRRERYKQKKAQNKPF